MKLKYWPRYLARHALCYCRDIIAPSYPVERIEADFFVSMGANCTAAGQLLRKNLRICASPLDWMKDYSLADAAELFKDGFSTFFTDIREHPDAHKELSTRDVEDLKNGMHAIHHFPRSMSLEDGKKFYRERAMRHFANTHHFMTEAEHIAIVTNRTESIDDICRFLTAMKLLYSAKIVHINVRYGAKRKRETVDIPDGSTLYDYEINASSSREYDRRQIEYYEWRRILGKCCRTKKFSPLERLKNNFTENNPSSN